MAQGKFAVKTPTKFLEVRIRVTDPLPGLLGLCAGYESGKWRAEQLGGHLMEWLPEFALTEQERAGISSDNMIALAAKAARAIYSAIDTERRGEIGELLLHAAIRQEFESVPAISKIYFKDSTNDTVKGFDAVHIVQAEEGLQLWLGESKFYKDLNSAMNEVIAELKDHTKSDYLRTEFTAIANKIDSTCPFAQQLEDMVHRNKSLDKIFQTLCFPVLLTYESKTIASHTAVCQEFLDAIQHELKANHKKFCEKDVPKGLVIHLILFPLLSKESLVSDFDRRLKACQIIAN